MRHPLPVPIHRQEAYSFNGYQNKHYPRPSVLNVSLPMYPELTGSMIETVCAEIKIMVQLWKN